MRQGQYIAGSQNALERRVSRVPRRAFRAFGRRLIDRDGFNLRRYAQSLAAALTEARPVVGGDLQPMMHMDRSQAAAQGATEALVQDVQQGNRVASATEPNPETAAPIKRRDGLVERQQVQRLGPRRVHTVSKTP